MWTTAYVTRNHSRMVYDTLFGQEMSFKPSPQSTCPISLGQYLQPTAHRTSLTGVPDGFALFWNVKRA